MRRYRVLLPLLVHTEDGEYGQGDEFEKEFTAEDEATNLASGLLEIVPSEYRVVGGSVVLGHEPGDTFTEAIPLGQEQLLIEGGHIERVVPKPAAKRSSKKPADGA